MAQCWWAVLPERLRRRFMMKVLRGRTPAIVLSASSYRIGQIATLSSTCCSPYFRPAGKADMPEIETRDAFEWRQIVDGATDTAIISLNPEGSITSWNTGAERILGWTKAEMIGATLERIFTLEAQQAGDWPREMADATANGRGGGEEGWRVRKDGSLFWAAGELTPIRARDGAITGFVKILRDRTAQRAAEENVGADRGILEILNRAGSALAVETDRHRVVQLVTDAGVELTGAQFGAFFYNIINDSGESYLLYTESGAPPEAF